MPETPPKFVDLVTTEDALVIRVPKADPCRVEVFKNGVRLELLHKVSFAIEAGCPDRIPTIELVGYEKLDDDPYPEENISESWKRVSIHPFKE